MKPVYVLHPGNVVSITDGDTHYIGVKQLAQLYGVKYSDCVVADKNGYVRGYCLRNAIHLYPDRKGNYKLPEIQGEE